MARRNLEKKVGRVSLVGIEVFDMQDFLEEEAAVSVEVVEDEYDHFKNEGYYDMEWNYHFYADEGADYRLGPM